MEWMMLVETPTYELMCLEEAHQDTYWFSSCYNGADWEDVLLKGEVITAQDPGAVTRLIADNCMIGEDEVEDYLNDAGVTSGEFLLALALGSYAVWEGQIG